MSSNFFYISLILGFHSLHDGAGEGSIASMFEDVPPDFCYYVVSGFNSLETMGIQRITSRIDKENNVLREILEILDHVLAT